MVNVLAVASSVNQRLRRPRLAIGVSRTNDADETSTPGVTVTDVLPAAIVAIPDVPSFRRPIDLIAYPSCALARSAIEELVATIAVVGVIAVTFTTGVEALPLLL